jgi:hypothetical protein
MFDDMVDMVLMIQVRSTKKSVCGCKPNVSGNGESWASAYKTLAEAWATALCGNVQAIHVARGTYYPNGQQNSTTRDRPLPYCGAGLNCWRLPDGRWLPQFWFKPHNTQRQYWQQCISTDNIYHVLVIAGLTPTPTPW